MEAYFHNDPRIRKWINQIIERIFTVCILTGVNSDEEFQKGCQIVMKLASLLKETPTLPSELLEDGVRQLLEQQLPDARVINNFPEFHDIMGRMLQEGIAKAAEISTDTLSEASYIADDGSSGIYDQSPTISITNANSQKIKGENEKTNPQILAMALAKVKEQAKAETQVLEEKLAEAKEIAKAEAQAFAEELAEVKEQAKAETQVLEEKLAEAKEIAKAEAQAFAEELAEVKEQAKAEVQAMEVKLAQTQEQAKAEVEKYKKALAEARGQAVAYSQAEEKARADALAFAETLAQVDAKLEAITKKKPFELTKPMSGTKDYFVSINAMITQLFTPASISQQAELLKHVLSNIFPKGTISWNKKIMGQTFLAQVEDILIFVFDPEQPCDLEEINQNGWKVLVCRPEDLGFPRRMERQIRQLQRSKSIATIIS